MPTSSQGIDMIAGARKITIKSARGSAGGAAKLDASTLEIPHGCYRVYEDGMPDGGTQGDDGIVVTVSAEGLGTKPSVGSTVSAFGKTCICTESSTEASVGELAGWTASYTSDYVAPGSEEPPSC